MPSYIPAQWECENCSEWHEDIDRIWDCPGCEIEVCEMCFGRMAHCHNCSEGISDEELKYVANEQGFDLS